MRAHDRKPGPGLGIDRKHPSLSISLFGRRHIRGSCPAAGRPLGPSDVPGLPVRGSAAGRQASLVVDPSPPMDDTSRRRCLSRVAALLLQWQEFRHVCALRYRHEGCDRKKPVQATSRSELRDPARSLDAPMRRMCAYGGVVPQGPIGAGARDRRSRLVLDVSGWVISCRVRLACPWPEN